MFDPCVVVFVSCVLDTCEYCKREC